MKVAGSLLAWFNGDSMRHNRPENIPEYYTYLGFGFWGETAENREKREKAEEEGKIYDEQWEIYNSIELISREIGSIHAYEDTIRGVSENAYKYEDEKILMFTDGGICRVYIRIGEAWELVYDCKPGTPEGEILYLKGKWVGYFKYLLDMAKGRIQEREQRKKARKKEVETSATSKVKDWIVGTIDDADIFST